MIDGFFSYVIIGCLIVLAVCIVFALIRGISGKGVTNRIVAANMIGTMATVAIILLSILLGEKGLLDVSLLYAMLSFLAVVVLCKVYLGVYKEKHVKEDIENQGVKEEKK
ncbi:MAG: monovalent cation/H+ antiporter complex subunit F [Lachnospiraceae bacterium]|nr:monovalent cation/H+ antiporter complex subunit F [Lachnospiraceae bacterium]